MVSALTRHVGFFRGPVARDKPRSPPISRLHGTWVSALIRSGEAFKKSVSLKSRQWRRSCARMVAGLLEEDYRPPPRATGHERALCICGFRGRVFLNNAQLYLPGCNHVAEQFEPFGTFEDTGYRHWLDLDSPFGGLVSPAANRNVDAPITDGAKGLFPKGRRIEQRVDAIGQLPADRFGEAWSARPRYPRRSCAPARHLLGWRRR